MDNPGKIAGDKLAHEIFNTDGSLIKAARITTRSFGKNRKAKPFLRPNICLLV